MTKRKCKKGKSLAQGHTVKSQSWHVIPELKLNRFSWNSHSFLHEGGLHTTSQGTSRIGSFSRWEYLRKEIQDYEYNIRCNNEYLQ